MPGRLQECVRMNLSERSNWRCSLTRYYVCEVVGECNVVCMLPVTARAAERRAPCVRRLG